MEAGINADQNFYRRPFPQSSSDGQVRRNYEPAQLDSDSRPPQVPPKVSLLATNLQVAAASAYGAGDSSPAPDDFYREYRGIQSASGYSDINANGIQPTMSTTTAPRIPTSSFRSNGNGSTPKHPQVQSSRNAPKATYLSPSAPIDERIALNTARSTSALNGNFRSPQPSVKDLLKRFDKNGDQTASTLRKPLNRTTASNASTGTQGYLRSRSDIQGENTSGPTKAGVMTRETGYNRAKSPPVPRTTQRSRFSSEDQHSNNTLSSVPRATRSRQDISKNSQATRSMVNLSPKSPPKAPSQLPTRRPLFGEVVLEESGAFNPGFGITNDRVRRTSDSSLHPPLSHQRNQSEPDVYPPSPTAWYRDASSPLQYIPGTGQGPTPIQTHNRSRSDVADGNSKPVNGVSSTSDAVKSPTTEIKPLSHSRLPVSSKRLSNPSDSASPPLSRATSPTARAPVQNIANTLKPGPRPWSPAGRSTTPTHRHGRHSPSPARISTTNSSLKAYISAPPPKLSPPLRSSRPRLPVSTASTTSSRAKAADRSGSPDFYGYKSVRSESNGVNAGGRGLMQGPVDFAARRERIHKAYTKSIQESEEKELRKAELRRHSKAHLSDDKSHEPTEFVDTNVEFSKKDGIMVNRAPSPRLDAESSLLSDGAGRDTSHQSSEPKNSDSPSLGVPGSFPDTGGESDEDDRRSGVTEFDNEPQTEPARNSRGLSMSLDIEHSASIENADHGLATASSDEIPLGNETIQIVLETSSVDGEEISSSKNSDLEIFSHFAPQGTSEQLEYGEPVFASTSSMEMLEEELGEQPVEILALPDLHTYERGALHEKDRTDDPSHLLEARINNGQAADVQNNQASWNPTAESRPLPKLQTQLTPSSRQDIAETPVTAIDSDDSDDGNESRRLGGSYLDATYQHMADRRHSHHSNWTNYSVDTFESSLWEPNPESSLSPPTISHQDDRPQPPPKEIIARPEVPPKPINYSPLSSPRSVEVTPRMASSIQEFSPAPFQGYMGFSELERRNSQVIAAYANSVTETKAIPPIPELPGHSPPPPPPPPQLPLLPNSSRSQYQIAVPDQQKSSVRSTHEAESRRGSADGQLSSRPSLSTPLSSTRISIIDDNSTNHPVIDETPKVVELTAVDKEVAEKQAKRLLLRGHVIKELIDTESVYLKDMNVVEEIYKGTAEACPKLDNGDIKTIFRNTDQIVAFSTMFLDELKAASSSVYSPRSQKSRESRKNSQTDDGISMTSTLVEESEYEKDRKTQVGEHFGRHLKEMQVVYTDFLKSSEQASNRLAVLQSDPAVKVWLNECNAVAKDLTAAWDLDALLIKPVQRITRYQLLLRQLLDATPEDHPDHKFLKSTHQEIGGLLKCIDDLKKRILTVNKIVGRKRKDSEVRSGFAKAFTRSREKPISSYANRPDDDEDYMKAYERFADDYIRLQVVLRDVEFYTRQCNTYVSDFLRFLAAIELMVRVQTTRYPELDSKWTRFSLSMRDMGTIALEDHLSAVRKVVIEPFEHAIKSYEPPEITIRKRKKRRLDYERYLGLKAANKKIDDKLKEYVEEYEALNETLKFELPKLSALTSEIGRICHHRLIGLQIEWQGIWVEKLKTVLEESQMPKDVNDILDKFHRDYKYQLARIQQLTIANGTFLEAIPKGRLSQSTTNTKDDDSSTKSRYPPLSLENRPRGHSTHSDVSPSLPTPDFLKRHSDQFTFSPVRDCAPVNSPEISGSASPAFHSVFSDSHNPRIPPPLTRPGTGTSYDAGTLSRRSVESNDPLRSPVGSAYYTPPQQSDSYASRPFSGFFQSALPTDDYEDQSSSRASSHDRERSGGYNVLYLAASLFEFDISENKREAGYPYLTYQAGEIFDVIGEKGELWLAKNQDDPANLVGWIWSKHFARLAAN